jgi:BirA family biotin operon repressor/biotin-[acetyl-CoA-carboxylase] ligase
MDEEEVELYPTVIVAGRQTSGVGRVDRSWESPPGGLYLNWVGSGLSRDAIGQLPMLAAAAAHRSVVGLGVAGAGIKWPNDIVVEGRKLAGILINVRQGSTSRATIGLGVNLEVTPTVGSDATLPPTSVAEHIKPATVERWCYAIVSEFVRTLTASLSAPGPALDTWRRHLIHRTGDSINVRLAAGAVESGVFKGLTEEGYLRLEQDGEERIITGGDVIETG